MATASKAVLVLPHQDDEMFLFHRLRALLRQGVAVHAAWLTDGASHDADLRRDPAIRCCFPILVRADNDTIRRVREQESRTLMQCLGVPTENLVFMGHPSGRLHHRFSAILDELQQLFCRLQPQEIYTVAFDHSHFEHDLCNAAVRLAAPPSIRLCEFPVLSLAHGIGRYRWLVPHTGVAVYRTPFSRGEERLRLDLFRRAFPSQWSVALLERLCGLFPSDYRRFGEPYREMPHHDYSRPVSGIVAHYRPKSLTFEDVRRTILPSLENRPTASCVDE
jgi:LmbE family N-acetylglucosaminyl deacetylase